MPELRRLRADHAPAVLAFELANRAWFAASITDRGDAYFAEFPARHAELLAEQEAGTCAFHVLVAEDGSVLGRFNLVDIADGTAVLGYRMAEAATGRGLATRTVHTLCHLAATRYALHTLHAATSHTNTASQRVLAHTHFVPNGPADPSALGGKAGVSYVRHLRPARAPGR
ncbi:GNAT family N-acetyltransferase [Streptomyces sp. J2-1]|uniref:GNAT family N-acetyltransferase n=1 Tax=Streptomyces corallincola TaxID=2851888 RepID=UPI001C3807C8|nr:GNAT family N-acetyltransferase [Streptomyces corallincola]MBV2356844.1 GNAT family N-acetyltransferase [Streptomyces corallincola]